jgi:DNA repair ATPase RecN
LFGICDESEVALERWAVADAAAEYIQLQDRIKRAIDAGKLGESITPARYMLWAANSDIAVPSELKQVVEARNESPNWKARYDDLSKQHQELVAQCDVLRRELTEMKSKTDRDEINPKERTSMCQLIIVMAIGGYGYNPKAKRGTTANDI